MNQIKLYGQHFKITFWLLIIFEIASFLGYFVGPINHVVFFLTLGAALVLSFWKIEYGFWIALAELIVGSKGYLFSFDMGEFTVSIRLGIFLAVFLGWLFHVIRARKITLKRSPFFLPFLILLAFLILGVVMGVLYHNDPKNIFFDVNGYLYFGLLFVGFTVINNWKRISQTLQTMFASVSVIGIKTLFLLYYFSHQTDETLIRLMYRWVRNTGVGEIAQITENFFRIFFQSHIWALFAFLIAIVFLVGRKRHAWRKEDWRVVWLVAILSSLTLTISFSRSFWLALAISLVVLFIYWLAKEKIGWQRFGRVIGIMVGLAVLEVAFITFLINVQLPGGRSGSSAASLIRQRITTTEEPALGSRFQLFKPLVSKALEHPIFGSGFGTTVTYQTLDPRTKELNGGNYTSYAFEWGYLDIALKMGFLGLAAYVYFLWVIARQGLMLIQTRPDEGRALTLGLLFAFLALIITHFTTPYLNHPLGIMFIVVFASIIMQIKSSPNGGEQKIES